MTTKSFHHTLINLTSHLRSTQPASGLPPWDIIEIFPYAPYFDRLYSLTEVEKIEKAIESSRRPSLSRIEAEWTIAESEHIILSRHTTPEEQQTIINFFYFFLLKKENGQIDIDNTEFFDLGKVTRIIISFPRRKVPHAKDIIAIIKHV